MIDRAKLACLQNICVIAVRHQQFRAMATESIKAFGKSGGCVIVDLGCVVESPSSDIGL